MKESLREYGYDDLSNESQEVARANVKESWRHWEYLMDENPQRLEIDNYIPTNEYNQETFEADLRKHSYQENGQFSIGKETKSFEQMWAKNQQAEEEALAKSERLTEMDKYVVKHKTKAYILDETAYPYYLSKYNDGIFKDMNYPFPRLSLTTDKYRKSKVLTFETEEAAKQYLQDNKEYTEIDQLEVVLRITPEEEIAKKEKSEKILKRAKARRQAEETGNWEEFNKAYPPDKRLNFTFRPHDREFDDSDDDFEARIMRDLENGDGDIHGL